MNFTVFSGPDPDANRDMLFRKTAIEKGPLCIVVPDSRSVAVMQERLAGLSGGSYLGHRIYTFEGLAHAILSDNAAAPEPVSNPVKRAIVSELVKRRTGTGSRYAKIAAYQGFVSLFISWLEETKSGTVSVRADDTELASLALAYEEILTRLGLDDHEGIVLKALGNGYPEYFAGRFDGAFILDGFYDFTPRQFDLVTRLVEAFPRSAATLLCDSDRPGLFSLPLDLLEKYRSIGGKTVAAAASAKSSLSDILNAFQPHRSTQAPVSEAGSVELHTFRNSYSEADWLAGYVRHMIAYENVSPRDIMIVTRFSATYGTPLVMSLLRYSVPVEGGIQRKLTTTPVVRFALDALEAAIHPENEDLIRKVQRSTFTVGRNCGGRDMLEGIDEKGWSCRIAEFDTAEGYVASLKNVLGDLGLPKGIAVPGDSNGFFDLASYELLLESLDSFAGITSSLRSMMRAGDFSSLLRDFLATISAPMAVRQGEGVLVTDVMHARYISRDVTIITGLDDASYPHRESGFSLMSAADTGYIRNRHALEEPLLFYSAAAGASNLILTFPGVDDEGGDGGMSPYVGELRSLSSGSLEPRFHAAVPGASWEGGPRDSTGAGECLARALTKNPAGMNMTARAVSANDSVLHRRMLSSVNAFLTLNDSPGIDISNRPYFINAAANWGEDTVFNVTSLEVFMDCPIRFYFSKIVGLDVYTPPPGEIEPAIRGSILHDILAAFFASILKQGWRDVLPPEKLHEAKAIMAGTVDSVFNSYRTEMNGVHALAIMTERKAIHSLMERFTEAESRRLGDDPFRPLSFEVSFGRKRRDDAEPYPPLEAGDSGESLMIGGRIDRIDTAEINKTEYFRVIDYKSGGSVSASAKDLRSGKALQAPLYIEAVRSAVLKGSNVFDGALYSLRDMTLMPYKDRTRPLQTADWDGCIDNALRLVRDAARSIRSGQFRTPAAGCSNGRCEFISVCRGGCHGKQPSETDGDADNNND